MTTEANQDPDKKTVLNLYAAFGVSIVLTLVPSVGVAVISLLFLMGVLVAAYRIRRNAEKESLAENHCTFVIRTIWISALLGAITTAIGGAYMLSDIRYEPLFPCMENMMNTLGVDMINSNSMADIMHVYGQLEEFMRPCYGAFWEGNQQMLIIAAAITAAPILIYIAYRYVKGLVRALKGYRIANPESWL